MSRRIVAIDCETDPFLHGRVPEPFIWGSFDGNVFLTFNTTEELVSYYENENVFLFAHNGGKFDFMFLLKHVKETRALIINSRIVEMKIGKAVLRDSWAIIPIALRDFMKKEIAYWKLERNSRAEHMAEIIDYLRVDVCSLHSLVSNYFETAGKRSTIASNAMAFAKKQGLDPGKTNATFDAEFRPYYAGGRTQSFAPGIHEAANVYDIKSSYPFAMSDFHGTGNRYISQSTLDGLETDAEIGKAFIRLSCYSNGAFPVVENGGLSFPKRIGEYRVTGWEYLTAKKHGLISGEQIRQVMFLEKEISFKEYVDYWFEHKNEADKRGDKAQRIIGKIMLNSLYGKLAQNPQHYSDYKIVPEGTPIDDENGWSLESEFDGLEIHARPVLWRYQRMYGDDWKKFPMHFNVATGASITGFARAQLLDAIHTVGEGNVLYCDTDSLHLRPGAPVHLLRQDGKLGAWEWEGLATPAIYAGKKLYGLKFTNGPKSGETKIVSKGAKLSWDDLERIARGEIITWKNDAPTFSVGRNAKFIVRKIRATAHKP